MAVIYHSFTTLVHGLATKSDQQGIVAYCMRDNLVVETPRGERAPKSICTYRGASRSVLAVAAKGKKVSMSLARALQI